MLALFEPTQVTHGDRVKRGQKISCGNCGASEKIPCNSVSGPPNVEEENRLAARKFTTAGWLVGRRPRDHRCPRCAELVIKRSREERVRKINGIGEQPHVVSLAPAFAAAKLIEQPKAAEAKAAPENAPAPDRNLTRDDRRVIWLKLQEVYKDETSGYKPGWNDTRVARDLAVPVSWVKAVRDENFGALADNPETRAIVEEARGLLDDIKGHIANAQQLVIDLDGVTASMAETQRRVIELEQRLAVLIDAQP